MSPFPRPTVTAISGELVPNATMVSPTTRGEMPNDRASLGAHQPFGAGSQPSEAESKEEHLNQHRAPGIDGLRGASLTAW